MLTSAKELLNAAPLVSVGILTADLLRLGEELDALDEADIGLVHVDVMDAVFCPPMTCGPPIVSALPERFVKDVHLMIDEPLSKTHAYVEAGAGILTIHVESSRHPHRILQSLAGTGVVRGVALNPGTAIAAVQPLLDELELLLMLGVNPGWRGQSLIDSTTARLDEARARIGDREIVLAIDGGITAANIKHVIAHGADLVVTGSAVYDGGEASVNARALVSATRGEE